MKAYGELEKIAAAKPEDIAEKCGVTIAAAYAVRAAARLAIEDKNAKLQKFAVKSSSAAALADAASLTDEAFAAETPPDYD